MYSVCFLTCLEVCAYTLVGAARQAPVPNFSGFPGSKFLVHEIRFLPGEGSSGFLEVTREKSGEKNGAREVEGRRKGGKQQDRNALALIVRSTSRFRAQ